MRPWCLYARKGAWVVSLSWGRPRFSERWVVHNLPVIRMGMLAFHITKDGK